MANLQGTTITGNISVTGTATGQGLIPPGGIMAVQTGLTGSHSVPGAGAVDADGWMICDGSSVPSSQTISGTLPNLTDGRFLRGNTHGNCGGTAGVDSHSCVTANHPEHTHAGPSHTHTGPDHTHSGPDHTHAGPNHTHSGPNHTHTISENRNYGQNINTNAGNHSHQVGYIRSMQGPQAQFIMGDHGSKGTNASQSGGHGHNFNVGQNLNFGGGTNNSGTGGSGHGGTGGNANSGTGGSGASGTGANAGSGTGATANYGASSVTAIPTLPKYLHVVYLMRVI